MKPTKLFAAMCLGNEADRYLEEVLIDLDSYVDEMVFLDDCSTDESVEIAESFDNSYVYHNKEPLFQEHEFQMRMDLWTKYLPRHLHQGEWVLSIDCDELIESRFKDEMDSWLNLKWPNRLTLNCIELWGSRDMVRVDKGWNPIAGKIIPMLVRWMPSVNYIFEPSRFHTGRVPLNQPGPWLSTSFYMVHLGWADVRDIKSKRRFYKKMDEGQKVESINAHYESMFDTNPQLVPLDVFIPGFSKKHGGV